MNTTLSHWMTLILAILVMFTPMLAYVDSLHRNAVDTAIHEASKKASIQGHFTPTIIQDMEDRLVEKYKFDRNKIIISATTTLTQREEYIEATITVPRTPIFIFDLFNQGPTEIKRTVRIMSEYTN